MEFEIEFIDGGTETIELPDELSYRQGKYILNSMPLKAKGMSMKDVEYNPAELLTSITDATMEMVLPKRIDSDEIKMSSATKIAQYYYESLQEMQNLIQKKSRPSEQ